MPVGRRALAQCGREFLQGSPANPPRSHSLWPSIANFRKLKVLDSTFCYSDSQASSRRETDGTGVGIAHRKILTPSLALSGHRRTWSELSRTGTRTSGLTLFQRKQYRPLPLFAAVRGTVKIRVRLPTVSPRQGLRPQRAGVLVMPTGAPTAGSPFSRGGVLGSAFGIGNRSDR